LVDGGASATGARPRVLVVDDVETVRAVAQRVLDRVGYDTEVASDGASAVDRIKAGPTDFDAVLLDLSMPGMGGEETLCAIRAIVPDLPVVFMTGFSESMTRTGFLGDDPCLGFVHKPFRPQDLETEIGRVRAARQATSGSTEA